MRSVSGGRNLHTRAGWRLCERWGSRSCTGGSNACGYVTIWSRGCPKLNSRASWGSAGARCTTGWPRNSLIQCQAMFACRTATTLNDLRSDTGISGVQCHTVRVPDVTIAVRCESGCVVGSLSRSRSTPPSHRVSGGTLFDIDQTGRGESLDGVTGDQAAPDGQRSMARQFDADIETSTAPDGAVPTSSRSQCETNASKRSCLEEDRGRGHVFMC